MRKILSLLLISGVLSSLFLPILALSAEGGIEPTSLSALAYPAGGDFARLKSLIEANFSPKQGNQYNCISNNTLCPNYKYTSVIEKAIKLIVSKTYTGNEKFYDSFFSQLQSYGSSGTSSVKSIIDRVPRGSALSDWKSLGFGNSIGGELLDASF